jgi:hypothetical protein
MDLDSSLNQNIGFQRQKPNFLDLQKAFYIPYKGIQVEGEASCPLERTSNSLIPEKSKFFTFIVINCSFVTLE